MAQELNVPRESIRKILVEDLGLKAYKKRKVLGITAASKIKRFERYKTLIDWHAGNDFIFSDEKLCFNHLILKMTEFSQKE
jgi:inhibitor of nuclear factor kappa-B kinase subunit alpha